MNIILIAAAALSLQSSALIRHYLFDEGSGDEVQNHVIIEEGRRAETGGPLGSLAICRTTPYGIENVESYKISDTNIIESQWCKGRYGTKSALRVGTHPVGLYKSGITGNEFTNGFTFAGWIKFEGDKNKRYASSAPLRIGTGVCDEGLVLSWNQSSTGDTGTLSFRIGRSATDGGNKSAVVELTDCASDVWHAFACGMDGENISLWLDGRIATTNAASKFIPSYKTGTWVGTKPFTGGTRVKCLHIGNRITPSCVLPFVFDELAIFNRPLSAEEIKSFLMARPAEGSFEEQRANSLSERKRREALEKIEMTIPRDSNGYFRSGDSISVKVRSAPKLSRLEVFLETTRGNVRFRKTIPVDDEGNLDWAFTEKVCDAYNLFLTLKDASGNVIKKTDMPYVIGIVPRKTGHLNSPFGFWAMDDDFSYDSNLRRTYVSMWQGVVQTNEYLRRRNHYLQKQKIPAADLREYTFFPYNCDLNLPSGHKLSDDEKSHIRKCYKATAELAALYGIKEFEVTSEVDGRTTEDIYIQLLDLTKEALEKSHSKIGYKLYPPGATPCAIPFINKILELGAAKYVDGVSHHNYLSNPVYNYHWDNPGRRLSEVVGSHSKKVGRKLRMYNTESGVFSLPYVKNRPMTREHARTVGYNISYVGGYETYTTSMPSLPDDEAAAIQVHAILVNLASGYEMYVKCQTPMLKGALPCRQGVAITALSGQVLNDMTSIREVKLSSLNSLALLIDRVHPKTGQKSNCFTLFGMEKKEFTFKVPKETTFKTMDILGNFGEVKSDASGILKINSSLDPIYIFDVPSDIVELSPMKIRMPNELPEDGVMHGTVVIENPFNKVLKGTLVADNLRGAEIQIQNAEVELKSGEACTIPFSVKAKTLKRRNYSVKMKLGTLSAEAVFASKGLIYTIPLMKDDFKFDGDESKWNSIPEMICDNEDDVVYGKPNFAEQWLPQWMNSKDLSLRVKLCYKRDDAIYFRLDATDQSVVPFPESEKGLEFRYDCVELFVDTRRGKALGASVDFGADQVIIPVLGGDKLTKSSLWCVKKDKSHVKVEAVGRRTLAGWMMEGKIIPEKNSSLRLRPGSRLMMDFIVDDCDDLSVPRKSAMAVHGSFNNNSNVAGWGRYELGL